ncbi:MAG: helix-turn-helix domain-containing protein [Bacteroidota bacterium]
MSTIPIRGIQPTLSGAELKGGFSLRRLSGLLEGTDMVQEIHRHDFFFILVIEEGTGNHEIDFSPYPVTKDCVFFMRPGQVHKLTLHAGCTGYLLQFSSEFFYPKDRMSRQLLYQASGHCQLEGKETKRLVSLLKQIFEEQKSRSEGYLEMIKANLNILFIELVRNWKRNKNPVPHTAPHSQEQLQRLHDLVEAHLRELKQVSQYAEMMNLSIYQVNAITKETLGKTCSEFINDLIVLESKRHLLVTSNQVKEIAFQLGYEDVSYFSRFFKKHTGYSPEAFRNACS